MALNHMIIHLASVIFHLILLMIYIFLSHLNFKLIYFRSHVSIFTILLTILNTVSSIYRCKSLWQLLKSPLLFVHLRHWKRLYYISKSYIIYQKKMKSNVNTGKKLKFVNSIHLIMNYNMDTNKPDNFHHKVF